MLNDKRVLAVIPARGGSKGLPGKNLRCFCGKPLVAWSIEQALGCNVVDRVVVSTDSDEIRAVSECYGANVPFLRPSHLAGDGASSIDVVIHALDYFESVGERYDYIVLVEPTSPLRDVSDIAGALALLAAGGLCESVVGVAKTEACHPDFLFSVKDGLLTAVSDTNPTDLRRQDLRGMFFYLEGTVYASTVAALRKNRSFYHTATVPWIVARYKAIEIDELSDFIAAEALMRAKQEGLLS